MKPQNSSPDQASAGAFMLFAYILTALVIAVAYFGTHKFHAAGWAHDTYYVLVGLSLLNVIYYGWIRRTLVFGHSATTVTGGTAVAASLFYIILIASMGAVLWNYNLNNARQSSSLSQQH